MLAKMSQKTEQKKISFTTIKKHKITEIAIA